MAKRSRKRYFPLCSYVQDFIQPVYTAHLSLSLFVCADGRGCSGSLRTVRLQLSLPLGLVSGYEGTAGTVAGRWLERWAQTQRA
jgi:hypothetical protein